MLNEKAMINHLIAGLILNKISQYFPNHMNLLEETSRLKLIYIIMQQKQI